MIGGKWICVCLWLLLIAGSASAQRVSVGNDRAADFSKFKTYSWSKGVPAKHPEVDRLIVASIQRQLEARGLTRVNENSDMLISYHAAVIAGFDEATVARPGTWGPRTGSMEQVWQVVRGSLIVEILDGTSKQEVWRAVATDTLSNEGSFDATKDLNKSRKKIDKVVEKMFKYYPSTTKH
jgi:Domain of unknown function (DUF4136)